MVNKWLFAMAVSIIILNFLDIYSTALCLNTGLSEETNPLVVMLWGQVGFFNLALLKLFLPVVIYVLAATAIQKATKHYTRRKLLFAKAIIASIMLFSIASPTYAVVNNFIVFTMLQNFLFRRGVIV